MGSRFEVEVTLTSGRDLKNVNWRHGEMKPYAILWVEDHLKRSTAIAIDGDVNPIFEEKVNLPVPLPPGRRLEDCALYVNLVHDRSEGEEDTKPVIGSARLPLRDVLEEVGIGGGQLERTLTLKRPSGRPHGKIEVRVSIRDPQRYYDRYGAAAPSPYGQPAYYGGGNGQQLPFLSDVAPPGGYSYGAPVAYGGGVPAQMYGGNQSSGGYVEKQKNKRSGVGVGSGLAVGAVAGILAGLALAEGVDYVEDRIQERVEDDLAYEDGGYGGF